jgi:predicted nuclease with TOPRIM domain
MIKDSAKDLSSDTNLSSNTSKHDNYNDTISKVISQSTATNSQEDNSKMITRKKRTNSLNLDSTGDKKTKYNVNFSNFTEASKLINKIFERLDLVEDESNRLDSANRILTKEIKDTNNNYNKLASKHSNLLKDFDLLKQSYHKLQNDYSNLDAKFTNQTVDEMNGLTSNQLNPTSFADMLKSTVNNKVLSEPMAEIINTVNDYNRQKKGRENNLVVFGLKDINKNNINNKIKSLFSKLKVDEIKFNNPILLVKPNVSNTSPPVKITLENEERKFQILKAAKLLKEINQVENTKISIGQDLNEIDRERNRKLIEEKKKYNQELVDKNITNYYYVIRGNKIVKFDK